MEFKYSKEPLSDKIALLIVVLGISFMVFVYWKSAAIRSDQSIVSEIIPVSPSAQLELSDNDTRYNALIKLEGPQGSEDFDMTLSANNQITHYRIDQNGILLVYAHYELDANSPTGAKNITIIKTGEVEGCVEEVRGVEINNIFMMRLVSVCNRNMPAVLERQQEANRFADLVRDKLEREKADFK